MTSKKKQTVGYRYFLGLHFIGCHGPIDSAFEFIADDKIAWSGVSTGGPIDVDAKNLFGGEDKEGGVSGRIDFEQGLPTQGQNDYLVSKLSPSLVPYFRGLAGFVFRQTYIGTQTYIKKFAFRLSRIHVRENGIEQWYDEKAEISASPQTIEEINAQLDEDLGTISEGWRYKQAIFSDNADYSDPEYDDSSWPIGQMPFGNENHSANLDIYGFPTNPNTFWDVDSKIWIRKTFELSEVADILIKTFHDNFATYWINGTLVQAPSGEYDEEGYQEFIIPREVLSLGTNQITILAADRADVVPVLDRSYIATRATMEDRGYQKDMNPAHIIRECLTNPDWGMGYTDADIDDTAFTKAADTLYAEKMGISLLWNQQTEIEDFIKLIIRHIDAVLFVDRHTGKFNLKLVRADYIVDDLIILNESNIEKLDDFTRPQFGELTNQVTVKYWDAVNNIDATTSIQDIALAQMQGVTISVTNEYPGFTNGNIAARVAQRDMKTLSSAIASCTLYCNRDASVLNIGDTFKLSWTDFNLNELVMRISGIDYGDGKSNQVRIQCTEDIYGLPATALINKEPIEWEDPNSRPMPATNRLVYEVPYLEAIQQYSQAEIDALLTVDPNIGYAGATAGKPKSSYLNANMYVDSGAGYQNEATVDFCPIAKLLADIDKMATAFDIDSVVDIANAVDGSWFQIDNEIMVKVSYVAPTLTVKRGALDTVPEIHSANATLYFWDNYASNDDNQYLAGESLNIKLATVTGLGELALVAAPTDTLDIVGRMARPYPPGNFKINDEYFPPSGGSSLNISWAHRSRKLQTGGIYLGFTDGSIGPETGTTYNVKIYDNTDETLLYQNLGLVGDSVFPIVISTNEIRIELESQRDSLNSYQKQVHILDLGTSGVGYNSRGLEVGGGAARWAVEVGGFIYAIKDAGLLKQNLTTLVTVASDAISNNLMGMVTDGTNLFTVDIGNPGGSIPGKLRKYAPDLLTHTDVNFPMLGDGFGVTFVAGSVWVSLPYSGKVRRYNPSTLATVADITVSLEVNRLTNDGTYVYAVDRISAKAYKIDPATNTIVLTITLSEPPLGDVEIAVSNNLLFITGRTKVMAYDVTTGVENTSIPTFSANVVNAVDNLVAFLSYKNVIVLNTDDFSTVGLFTIPVPDYAIVPPQLTLLADELLIIDNVVYVDYYNYNVVFENRITEAGDRRITESGDVRLTET